MTYTPKQVQVLRHIKMAIEDTTSAPALRTLRQADGHWLIDSETQEVLSHLDLHVDIHTYTQAVCLSLEEHEGLVHISAPGFLVRTVYAQ